MKECIAIAEALTEWPAKATIKHLVVSAVNLVEAGTLEVLRQCLDQAVRIEGWRVTAIVHDRTRVAIEGVNYITRPDVKPSWFKRIRFEYFECKALAEQLQPDFWLSLHDMTPSLGRLAGKVPQAVYCHNAMCFYRMPWREMWLDPKLILFSKFYAIFYRININRNAAVVVQQDWIRNKFCERFNCRNVIVANPILKNIPSVAKVRKGLRFFYPSFARVFKNFETVLSAWEIVCLDPDWNGELTLTIDESNRYGASLKRRFKHLRNVQFIGKVPLVEIKALYNRSDCLVFASKLETWGLPISEAKQAGLFILASDLPYAREAVGNYDGAAFFPAEDASRLAVLIRQFSRGQVVEAQAESPSIPAPYARNWPELFQLLLPLRTPSNASISNENTS